MDTKLFEGRIEKVHDADTITAWLDLGFDIHHKIRIRLWHPDGLFDAPEIRGPERLKGLEAKEFVEDWVSLYGPLFVVETHKSPKREKYGRYLADVITADGEHKLTHELLAADLATVKPWK
jgi:endonuclease YncB( thermonuclease family)